MKPYLARYKHYWIIRRVGGGKEVSSERVYDICAIGPLHDPVTRYQTTHTGEQVAQWNFQNKATRTSPPWPAFVFEVTLQFASQHVSFCTMWSDHAKGLLMSKFVACTQRAFAAEKLYLETGQNKLLPAQRNFVLFQSAPSPLLSWLAYWAWAVGYLCLNYRSVNGVPLSFQAIKEKKACKRSFFSFGKLFKLVLLLLVAAIAIDIYKHKGYKGTMLLVSFLFCAFLTSLWLMLFCTFESCQEFKSSVFFLLKASKTAQIARDYGIEQAVLTGYGQAKNGFDAANR